MEPIKVLLDSNFLLLPFQFRVDIFLELKRILPKHEVCVTRSVLRELEGIAKKRGAAGRQARAALALANKLQIIETECEDVDETLLALASRNTIIATSDKVLKESIRKKKAPVIYLRQKKYLEIEGYVD